MSTWPTRPSRLTPATDALPGQLLFYQPGGQQDQLGTLIGLRGILPAPVHENRWAGAVVRVDITRGQAAPVRFSLRRGFYFKQDLVVLKAYRKQLNVRRVELRARKAREGSGAAAGPAGRGAAAAAGGHAG